MLARLGALSDRPGWVWLLLAPALLLIAAVVLYPSIWGMSLSLREMRLNRPDLGTGFVGAKHYLALLEDPVFWLSLSNTAVWVCGALAGEFLLGFATALLLDQRLPGMRLASVLVLVPWFLPNVVAGNMWALMLDPRLGVINDLLQRAGLIDAYVAWFADPDKALFAAMLVEIWHGFPFFALLLLAGLKAIPQELHESAASDGANPWQRLRHVIVPQLRMIIVASIVLRVISLVNAPDIILVLTGGGPGRSTLVLSLYAFLKVSREFNFGYGSALAVILFVLLMGFAWLYVRLSNVLRED